MTHTLHEPTLPHLSQLGGYIQPGQERREFIVRLALATGKPLHQIEEHFEMEDQTRPQPTWRDWARKFIFWR